MLKHLKTLLQDAVDYPLVMRIAATMHMTGITSDRVPAMMKDKAFRQIPDPIKIELHNRLRDIERTGLSTQLEVLALNL